MLLGATGCPRSRTPQRAAAADTCAAGAWCEVSPLVHGELRGAWLSPEGSVWAVGDAGQVLRHDRSQWKAVPAPFRSDMFAIWGTSNENVWVSGQSSVIWHWNGRGWNSFEVSGASYLMGIWGSAPDDVWIAASPGPLHWDGVRWSAAVVPTAGKGLHLQSVWGANSKDVWLAGGASDVRGSESAALFHWDGSRWSEAEAPDTSSLYRVWGTSPEDVWLIARTKSAPIAPETCAVFLSVLYHRSNGAWNLVPGSGSISHGNLLFDVWGSDPSHLFAVGEWGTAARLDGKDWKTVDTTPTTCELNPLHAVRGPTLDEMWAVGFAIYRWDGVAFRREVPGASMAAWAITGTAGDDVWVGGGVANVLQHWDGKEWTPVPVDRWPDGQVTAIWERSRDDVWFASPGGAVGHFDGKNASLVQEFDGVRIAAVRGTAKAVWAIGNAFDEEANPRMAGEALAKHSQGRIYRWNGERFALEFSAEGLFTSIFVAGADDVLVSASGDRAFRFDGTAWTREPLGTNDWIRWIRKDAKGSLFAEAEQPNRGEGPPVRALLRKEGDHWERVATLSSAMDGVWANSASDVWAVGRDGMIDHWDGTSWQHSRIDADVYLNAAWGIDGVMWAAGNDGSMWRRQNPAR